MREASEFTSVSGYCGWFKDGAVREEMHVAIGTVQQRGSTMSGCEDVGLVFRSLPSQSRVTRVAYSLNRERSLCEEPTVLLFFVSTSRGGTSTPDADLFVRRPQC